MNRLLRATCRAGLVLIEYGGQPRIWTKIIFEFVGRCRTLSLAGLQVFRILGRCLWIHTISLAFPTPCVAFQSNIAKDLVVVGFPHTITDWMSLVTLDSSISTSKATASCTAMLDVIRAGRRPASISLGFWWLIVDYWLRTPTVV